jgi:hypothetical protein
MFAKVAFAFAVVLATASGAVAATKTHIAPSRDVQGVYNATGACAHWFSWPCGLSRDPDARVRFESNREWTATNRPYNPTGACAHWFSWPCGLSRDPDAHVRFELNREWTATNRRLASYHHRHRHSDDKG